MMTMRFAMLAVLCVGCASVNAAPAQAYPNKPIDLIVRFGTGGGADLMARELAKAIHEQHPDIVLQVLDLPGANSLRAVNHVMGLPADGYSVLEVDATIPLLQAEKKTRYSESDIDYVCQVDSDNIVYAALPDDKRFPDAKAMIAYASAHPVSIATTANGSSAELATRYANHLLHIQGRDVGYGHPGERITTMLGGHVDLIAENWGALVSLFQAGKLRPLLVLSPTPIASYAKVATSKDVGLNFTWGQLRGLAVKHGTPAAVEERLGDLCKEAVHSSSFNAFLAKNGETGGASYLPRADFQAVMAQQGRLFTNVLQQLAASPAQ